MLCAEVSVDGPVDGPVTLPDGASLAADLAIPLVFAALLLTAVGLEWLADVLSPAMGRARAALSAASAARRTSSTPKPAALAAAK